MPLLVILPYQGGAQDEQHYVTKNFLDCSCYRGLLHYLWSLAGGGRYGSEQSSPHLPGMHRDRVRGVRETDED
jgi:hypothetical protein